MVERANIKYHSAFPHTCSSCGRSSKYNEPHQGHYVCPKNKGCKQSFMVWSHRWPILSYEEDGFVRGFIEGMLYSQNRIKNKKTNELRHAKYYYDFYEGFKKK